MEYSFKTFNSSIDLNSLFSFDASKFKSILEYLITESRKNDDLLQLLKEESDSKQVKIDEMEQKLIGLSENLVIVMERNQIVLTQEDRDRMDNKIEQIKISNESTRGRKLIEFENLSPKNKQTTDFQEKLLTKDSKTMEDQNLKYKSTNNFNTTADKKFLESDAFSMGKSKMNATKTKYDFKGDEIKEEKSLAREPSSDRSRQKHQKRINAKKLSDKIIDKEEMSQLKNTQRLSLSDNLDLKIETEQLIKEKLNESIGSLMKKMEGIEQRIKMIEHLPNNKSMAEFVSYTEVKTPAIENEIAKLAKAATEMENKIESLSGKVMDFDIFEVLKNRNSGREGGTEGESVDEFLALVKNIEAKLIKKIQFVQSKIDENKDSDYKSKNDIIKCLSAVDSLEKKLEVMKGNDGQSNDMEEKIKKISDDCFKEIGRVNKLIDDKTAALKIKLDVLLENTVNEFKNTNMSAERLDELASARRNNDDESKERTEMKKQIVELERMMNQFNRLMSPDIFNSEIKKLKDLIGERASSLELQGIYNAIRTLNAQASETKDQLVVLFEDRNFIEELSTIKKRVDVLSYKMNTLKTDENQSPSNNHLRARSVDYGKFIETSIFQTFMKDYLNKNEDIHKSIADIKRFIDDLIKEIKSKVADDDLKKMEELFNNKFMHLTTACGKKFADKFETDKNIKYLNVQIKQLLDFSVKKHEKGDNSWIVAKKKLGENQCASCENYIGDLKEEQNGYLPWNKYPVRENDRAYRVGNGFSRLLNMMQIEGKVKKDRMYDSDGENQKKRLEGESLPKLLNSANDFMNTSGNNIESNGPKMLKFN